MAGIFLNYRRQDTAGIAGRLYDRLIAEFPRTPVFMDVTAIKPGFDFISQIEQQIAECDVLLALIGPRWLARFESDSGEPDTGQQEDLVRVEIASALAREIPVIPILIDEATMPSGDVLPDDIRTLARRHALDLRHARFASDADEIVRSLKELVTEPASRWRRLRLPISGLAFLAVLAGGAYWMHAGGYLQGRLDATSPTKPRLVKPPAPTSASTSPITDAKIEKYRARLYVAPGDSMAKVKAIYGLSGDPKVMSGGSKSLFFRQPLYGLYFFFDHNTRRLANIRADKPFKGEIAGIRVGDTLDKLIATHGQPRRDPWEFGGNKAHIYDYKDGSVRFDVNPSGHVETIFYF